MRKILTTLLIVNALLFLSHASWASQNISVSTIAELNAIYTAGDSTYAALADGDVAFVLIGSTTRTLRMYVYDADSAQTEDGDVYVTPDNISAGNAYTGDARWVLMSLTANTLILTDSGNSYVEFTNNTSVTPDASSYWLYPEGGAFKVSENGTEKELANLYDAQTFANSITLDDGSGASPDFTLTDATDETAVFSKVDSGFLTITTAAADGVQITTGNLKVGNGTPTTTQDGEDFYVEGNSEFDAAAVFDTTVSIGTSINPDTDGGASLGTTNTLEWQNLFMNTGAVINFENGDVTLTHSANTLTLGGGDLALGANNETLTGYIASGADPADQGAIRLANAAVIAWEDATELTLTHVDNTGLTLNGVMEAASFTTTRTTDPQYFRAYEGTGSGNEYFQITATAMAANVTLTALDALPASSSFLTISDAGVMSSTATNTIPTLSGTNSFTGANTIGDGGDLVVFHLDSTPASDATGGGEYITVQTSAGVTVAAGDVLVVVASASDVPVVALADADVSGKVGMILLATEAINPAATGKALLRGVFRLDSWDWAASNTALFVSGTAGDLATSAGTYGQKCGYALTDDSIYWNPSPDVTY